MKRRLIRLVVLMILGATIGAGLGYFQKQKELESGVVAMTADDQGSATILKEPTSTANTDDTISLGGNFTLVNQEGETVTQENYADTHKLIFFGFTFCPAVCPTELQKITTIMNDIGEKADKITPIFISIDPERDTPEVIKPYIAQFYPKLVGLTGTQEQIDAVKKSYRVYAAKVENEMMDGYMMDHSAFMYLMSPDNTLVALYPSKDTAEDISKDIESKLK